MDRVVWEREYKDFFGLCREDVPGLSTMADAELVRKVFFVRKLSERAQKRLSLGTSSSPD
jgi:hypothetical protein